jgi:sigma-B regulation protein RsbU (phosphoserine phosphatase)
MTSPDQSAHRRSILPRLTSRLPIKISVPLLLATPMVIVVVLLSLVAFLNGRAAVNDLASQNLTRIHEGIGRHIGGLLHVPRRINEVNASLIRQGKLDPNDLRAWRETFFTEAQAFDMVSAVVWGSSTGDTVWVALYAGEEHLTFTVKDETTNGEAWDYQLGPDGQIDTEPIATYPFDPRVRPWYTTPLRTGKPTWSAPFAWIDDEGDTESGTLGIAFGQPFRNDAGEIVGVVDADISLQDISRYLETLSIGQTGQAFVIDRSGMLIATSTGSPVVSSDSSQLAASDSPDTSIAHATDHLLETFTDFDAINAAYQQRLVLEDRPCLLMVSPFEHDTGLSWIIVTLVPESDFMAHIQAGQRQSFFISVVVIAAMLALGTVIATMMVRPIVRLVEHVRSIGQGDLDQRLHLTDAPELVLLSDEINQMSAGLKDRWGMRQALAMAMDVQQNLLPHTTPKIRDLDIAGCSTYCDQTGGDYYDFLDISGLSESTVAVAIGDVTGHGVAAAMLMATARGILVSRCGETGSLGDLLTHLNDHLTRDSSDGRFMTMLLLTVDAEQGQAHWASAGHDSPIIFDTHTGAFMEFEGGGLPLGVMEDYEYRESTFDGLRSGQIYFAGTDGVWETCKSDGDMFGKDRIRALIRANADRSADEISDCIRQALDAFRGESKQEDDITFVVIKVL